MKPPKETYPEPPAQSILVAYAGSIAHGTYQPQSICDRDVMGAYIGPVAQYLGFGRQEEVRRSIGEWDVVHYEIRKLFRLLVKSNPNVLSLLFLEPKHVIESTPVWDRVVHHRDWFISKKAYHSFSGYAYAQFKKMTTVNSEKAYEAGKRKELYEKHGYDTKNAAHLVRLLKMSIEYLVEGRLYVERKDAPQLLSIKDGSMTLAEIKEYATHLFREAESAYTRSSLPNEPDTDKIEELLVDILHEHFDVAS